MFTTFLFSGQFHQTHWSAAINHSDDRNSSCLTLSFIYCHPQQLKPPLVTNSQLELDSSDLSLVYFVFSGFLNVIKRLIALVVF